MFLKTVPPVVAVHSEWRSGESFSLPLCFHDSASDSDLASASGTPIPQKVQMIIDSLRGTQSSDMSEDVQAGAGAQSALDLARHAGHKVKARHPEALARSRRAAGLVSSDGSDSDDSVDRGIEEAIQQYLKEKGDHKEEPAMSPPQVPKVPQRQEPSVPEAPEQLPHSNSSKMPNASNQEQKAAAAPASATLKRKKPSKENPFRKMAPPSSGGQRASSSSSSCSPGAERTPPPLRVKEEESLDSSSDDGIEEAIQRFQQEQKDHQRRPSYLEEEELDSSSDDGIEEAILNFQQGKQKQDKPNLHPKPSPLTAAQPGPVPTLPTERSDPQPLKALPRKKSSGKRTTAEREAQSSSPKPLSASPSLGVPPAHSPAPRDAREPAAEPQTHSTLTVNTTAELMCAEAILDISKTVMPTDFEPHLSVAKGSEVEAPPPLPSALPPLADGKSGESSVDSEDGIEQEIRRFLELKAKMHELPAEAAAAAAAAIPEGPTDPKAPQKKKAEEDQSKALRLSLSRKRKRKEEELRGAKRPPDIFKEELQPIPATQTDASANMASNLCSQILSKHTKPKPLSPPHGRPEGSVPKDTGSSGGSRVSPMSQRRLLVPEQNFSSDKSSSLDSDEDLDAAIKDLLKTKKRVKKKVRDMKLKARKRLAQSPDKKNKAVLEQKSVLADKPPKPGSPKSSKEPCSQKRDKSLKPLGLKPQWSGKKPKAPTLGSEAERERNAGGRTEADPEPCVRLDADSSSVDSDDSIEQEIRRFLAEKAKVVPVPVASVKEEEEEEEEEEAGGGAAASFAGNENEWKMEDPALAGALTVKEERPQETPVTPAGTASAAGGGSAPPPSACCPLGDGRRTDGQVARPSDERRNGSLDTGKDRASFREGTSSDPFTINLTGPRDAQCQVKHQNLFLMKPENCGMTDIREPASADFRDKPSGLLSRSRIPLREVIGAVCSSSVIGPVSPPSETPTVSRGGRLPVLTPESRTDSFYLNSRIKRPPWDQPPVLTRSAPLPYPSNRTPNTVHLSLNPSHLSCLPLPPALAQPCITTSVVRLRRDQAAVIPLSPHKTNHLQLRNRQEERERERPNEGREEEEEEEEEEECVDETDVESGDERRVAEQQRIEKRQQQQQRSSQ